MHSSTVPFIPLITSPCHQMHAIQINEWRRIHLMVWWAYHDDQCHCESHLSLVASGRLVQLIFIHIIVAISDWRVHHQLMQLQWRPHLPSNADSEPCYRKAIIYIIVFPEVTPPQYV